MAGFVVNTQEQQLAMLKEIGKSSFDELFQSIPLDVRLKQDLQLPEGMSEFEAYDQMQSFAQENLSFQTIFRGAGAYHHYIPSVVRHLASREEFLTAYTPYQAEISQGILQSIFEYQTMICELTGMDVSNASVYDSATAAAEAINMCTDTKHPVVLISDHVDPQVIQTIHTYFQFLPITLKQVKSINGVLDLDHLKNLIKEDVACLLIQTPNYFGSIEDGKAIKDCLQSIKLITLCNPISLGVLEAPGIYGADIAVGDGQPLGMPLSFGGPYLGFMATKQDLARKLPGRIVGQTVDTKGQRAYTLTLQAREQHIRREKASSSICSNQAHCALTSAIYMASIGPKGLQEMANQCFQKAHYLQESLAKIGLKNKYTSPFFHEFVTTSDVSSLAISKKLEDHNILGGLPLNEREILWCVTEVNSISEMDKVVRLIKEVIASE